MPEPLKNIYNKTFFDTFAANVITVLPSFDAIAFQNDVFANGWAGKELKQRVQHIAAALHKQLPGTFSQQVKIIIRVITALEKQGVKGGFEYMFFPDFIEQYGQGHIETSLAAMERITQFISCEFAIRPFLLLHQERVMARMLAWSKHTHPHVRRFASEGCRPRLPWAMAIPALKKDPSPILPIFQNLKADDSLFVRKSVANNLNDIAKDHPDVVMELAARWKGQSAETDWIIRHGCRTLLKKAHPATYSLFGLDAKAEFKVSDFTISAHKLAIGDRLAFSFNLQTGKTALKLRLEYAVYYIKAGGKQSRKIFQISEAVFPPNKIIPFKKEQRFQDFTTRKHYPGEHKLAIVINGQEVASTSFLLSA